MDKGLDTSTHSLNNSTSKTKYTFSKAERFLPEVGKGYLCDKIYEVPNFRSKRATSFGIGKRKSFDMGGKQFETKFYDMKRDFDPEKLVKKRGFSFGYGRQKSSNEEISFNQHKGFPGPGHYDIGVTKQSHSVTLKSRKIDTSLKEQLLIPGPGSYDLIDELSPSGKYYSSKHSNTKIGKFNPLSNRIMTSRQKAKHPGPGQCTIFIMTDEYIKGTTSDGKQFISKFGTTLGSKFSKSPRKQLENNRTPGPGSYQIFSQFSQQL